VASDGFTIADEFYGQLFKTISASGRTFYRYGASRRSYAEALDYIGRIRTALQATRNRAVAVCSDKSFESYAAILGILMSGNSWVPISRTMPVARLAQMMKLASIEVLFVDESTPQDLIAHATGSGVNVMSLEAVYTLAVATEQLPSFDPDSVALIYFTSGSTGEPKGVRLTHRNYITVVRNILGVLPLRQGEVFGDYHDVAFVISVPIVFPCVLSEGAIAPALKPGEILLPQKHMAAHEISVLITVPSTFARLRNARADLREHVFLNVLILCGEPLHLDVLTYCFEYVRPSHIYNFYGSTEVAPWTFHHTCSPSDITRFADVGAVPIGLPLPGVSVRLDEATSELSVSGDNISPGYLRGLYADRFEYANGKRWYRTGDVVTTFDNVYICKGRLDSQIKIDGFRVELMDVEANLRRLSGVKAAVCFVGGKDSEKIIVAVLHTSSEYDVISTRQFLSQRLPSYMLPRKVVCLKDVPLNNSGKIDRRALQTTYG
jgi:D-alanine--poly(phosphoribitol) ligase subunit 1